MKTIFQYYPKITIMRGGGPVHILNIVKNMPGYKFQLVTNAVSGRPLIENLEKNTIMRRVLPNDRSLIPHFNPMVNRLLYPYNIIADLIREKNKKSYLKSAKFDLFHFHSGIISEHISRLASMLRRPIFVKQFDFSYISQPKVMTFHGDFYKPSMNPILNKYQNALIDQFENIICVDKNLYSDIKEYIEDTSQDKDIWFIPNSVDMNKFDFTPLPNKNKLRIGFIGRIENSRGMELFNELIKKLPKYIDLYMVGAGNTTVINKFKSKINTSKFNFYTNVKHNDIPKFLQKIDILFNPITDEGISIISLEAMACGRPTIMIDQGDRYPIINNKTGFLVHNNLKNIFELLQYLNDNREILIKASKMAREIIVSKFSNKVIIPKINKIYNSLMNI